MKKDVIQMDDVKILVDSFYGKVQKDALLKNIFNTIIQDRWAAHMEKMYTF